jgi:hypothetical protein
MAQNEPEAAGGKFQPCRGRSLANKDPEPNVRTPPTWSDLARTCAYFGLTAVIGVACLNPMPDEYPQGAAGSNPAAAAGASTGVPAQPGSGAGGMSSGGGAGASAAGSGQSAQAGSGSQVSDGGARDAGAPDADSSAAAEPDAGSGGP